MFTFVLRLAEFLLGGGGGGRRQEDNKWREICSVKEEKKNVKAIESGTVVSPVYSKTG